MTEEAIESVKELIKYPQGYATREEKAVFKYLQYMLDRRLATIRYRKGGNDE